VTPHKRAVWDLPTRLFHWLLVALIALCWWSAEEGELDLHLWLGMAVVSLLIFRLLWGLFGSSTARFANFVRGPRAVADYLQGKWMGIGHSPLGALSVVALLLLIAVQAGMGLFSTDEDGLLSGPLATAVSLSLSERLTDLHEELFDVLLVLIGIHVAAIIFYLIVKRRNLVGPMITGKAPLDADLRPMRPGKWWAALLCLIAAIAITRWIIAGAPPFGA
jgi:cytochrome b